MFHIQLNLGRSLADGAHWSRRSITRSQQVRFSPSDNRPTVSQDTLKDRFFLMKVAATVKNQGHPLDRFRTTHELTEDRRAGASAISSTNARTYL